MKVYNFHQSIACHWFVFLFTDDMYVLEINFYAVDNLTQLYKVDGEVYEKLDACLSKPLDKKRIHFLEQEVFIY